MQHERHPIGRRSGGRGETVAGLSGIGRVADDLYLMAHHEISGRPYVQARASGLGLAGALLAELMLAGHISLWHEEVVAAGRTAAEEELTGHPLGLLASEHEHHPVRDWLLFVMRTAAEGVARRLEDAGYLTRAGGRWRGRRWVPVDADSAFAPLLPVRAALDSFQPLTAHNAAPARHRLPRAVLRNRQILPGGSTRAGQRPQADQGPLHRHPRTDPALLPTPMGDQQQAAPRPSIRRAATPRAGGPVPVADAGSQLKHRL